MFLNYGNSENNSQKGYADDSVYLEVNSCGTYQLSSTDRLMETCRPHGRPDYQLVYVASGKGYFYPGRNRSPKVLLAGSMFLYHPGEFQKYEFHSENAPSIYWIHFTGSGVRDLFEKYGLDESENIFPSGTEAFYSILFDQIILELQLRKGFYQKSAALLLTEIIMLMGRYNMEVTHTNAVLSDNVNDAINFIREHFQESIIIDEYIKGLNSSPSTFFRHFKSYTGMTPLQFLLQNRINYAKKLLETTNLPVNEISVKVGYDNALYFSRLFHRHTGLSPKEYRKIN